VNTFKLYIFLFISDTFILGQWVILKPESSSCFNIK